MEREHPLTDLLERVEINTVKQAVHRDLQEDLEVFFLASMRIVGSLEVLTRTEIDR